MATVNTQAPVRMIELMAKDINEAIREQLRDAVMKKVLSEIEPMLNESVNRVCQGITTTVYEMARVSFHNEIKLIIERRGFGAEA